MIWRTTDSDWLYVVSNVSRNAFAFGVSPNEDLRRSARYVAGQEEPRSFVYSKLTPSQWAAVDMLISQFISAANDPGVDSAVSLVELGSPESEMTDRQKAEAHALVRALQQRIEDIGLAVSLFIKPPP
ncbi:MAG: hypothetical protein AB7G93_06205 [Bdellovibrionales bacterium]